MKNTLQFDSLRFLQLLQIADSALPIGSTAHSFGLETLAAEGELEVAQLEDFLRGYMQEAGVFEATICRLAYRAVTIDDQDLFSESWLALNRRVSATRIARESRLASATLGRRFLQLVQSLEERPLLHNLLQQAKVQKEDIHYCAAFGLVGSLLAEDETATVLAYLHQTLIALISACQRLLPLGQSRASHLLWQLKPALIGASEQSIVAIQQSEELSFFTPLADLGSMRHPTLPTRLFIS